MTTRAESFDPAGRANAPTLEKVAPSAALQLSFEFSKVVPEKSSRRGSARAPETPNEVSVGPTARTSTVLFAPGAMVKPQNRMLAPVPTSARLARLIRRESWAKARPAVRLAAATRMRASCWKFMRKEKGAESNRADGGNGRADVSRKQRDDG